MTKLLNGLEEFAEYLGYNFPEEIYEVAWYEGFYKREEFTGDYFLSKEGINDFLNRLTHGEIICTGIYGNRWADGIDNNWPAIEIEERA